MWCMVHGACSIVCDLGQAGAVVYLAHPLLPPPLPQAQSAVVRVIKVMVIKVMVIKVMIMHFLTASLFIS